LRCGMGWVNTKQVLGMSRLMLVPPCASSAQSLKRAAHD
jgi:hypothetical protein